MGRGETSRCKQTSSGRTELLLVLGTVPHEGVGIFVLARRTVVVVDGDWTGRWWSPVAPSADGDKTIVVSQNG